MRSKCLGTSDEFEDERIGPLETRFSAPEYFFGTEPNEFSRAQAHLLPSKGSALVVADGEGRNGVWLAEKELNVLSIDYSPRAHANAQALAKSRGVSLRTECLDVTTWKWPEAEFDVIAAIFIQFTEPDERKHIFADIRQALKPGALLLLEGYRPGQLGYKTGGPSCVENL
jgi:SAM-dependent methyltransferase